MPALYAPRYASDGSYVGLDPLPGAPSLPVRKAVVDLVDHPLPTRPVIPFMETVHDRAAIEVMPRRPDSRLAFYKEGYHLLLRDKEGKTVAADVAAAGPAAVAALAARVDEHFDKAIDLLKSCKGRVILTGMGKDGANFRSPMRVDLLRRRQGRDAGEQAFEFDLLESSEPAPDERLHASRQGERLRSARLAARNSRTAPNAEPEWVGFKFTK